MDSEVLCLGALGFCRELGCDLELATAVLSQFPFLALKTGPTMGGTGTGPGQMTFCSRPGSELEPGAAGESVYQAPHPVA